ncbi:unnamed protein product, partial [Amoebophrya sp. A25]|eukprot:GSA25T00023195001.1
MSHVWAGGPVRRLPRPDPRDDTRNELGYTEYACSFHPGRRLNAEYEARRHPRFVSLAEWPHLDGAWCRKYYKAPEASSGLSKEMKEQLPPASREELISEIASGCYFDETFHQ